MAFVRKNVNIPIMADEGVDTAADALRLIEADAMDAVSIKIWKMGGYYKSREIAAVCSAANVGVHVGSTAGSQLMEAMQLHFCASIPDLFAGAEIGEFESLNDDPASGLNRRAKERSRLRSPGLGVDIDMNKLQETRHFGSRSEKLFWRRRSDSSGVLYRRLSAGRIQAARRSRFVLCQRGNSGRDYQRRCFAILLRHNADGNCSSWRRRLSTPTGAPKKKAMTPWCRWACSI